MKFVSLFDVNNYVKSVVGVVPVLFVRIRKKFRIQQDPDRQYGYCKKKSTGFELQGPTGIFCEFLTKIVKFFLHALVG